MHVSGEPLQTTENHKGRFILMFIVSTLIAAAFWYFNDTVDWKMILSAYLYTFSLWEGNYRFALWAIRKYPTLADIRNRLVVSFLFIFLFTLLVCLLWEGILYQYQIELKKFVGLYLFSVLITFLISSINGAVAYFQLFVQSIKEQEALRRLHMENEIKVLTSQVNPHFLFNSLNTLIALIPQDSDTAVRFTQKLSEVYRYVLQAKNKDLVSVEEELVFVDNYIFLLMIRYGNNLVIEKQIDPLSLSMQIPVLSTQLLVENAIKHNTISAAKPLRIKIIAAEKWLTISNNRNKKQLVEPGTGTGLENIRKRYELYSKNNIHLEDEDEFFIVKLPLLKVTRYESADHRG